MEKKIKYQVSCIVRCTINYLQEEDPGEHYFSITRQWSDGPLTSLPLASDEDEAVALVKDGKVVEVEGYSGYLRAEEEDAIKVMMVELLSK